ncbi:hypothetical protein HmCmsJML164_01457 [Escherichia coli]|nr:hypothetical protein HmCmsJML164_01457 [Escherichia coli]
MTIFCCTEKKCEYFCRVKAYPGEILVTSLFCDCDICHSNNASTGNHTQLANANCHPIMCAIGAVIELVIIVPILREDVYMPVTTPIR